MSPAVAAIAALDDPRVADYQQVRDARRLRERGLFVAESRHVVRRLLDEGRFPLRSLLLSEPAHAALAPHLRALPPATPC